MTTLTGPIQKTITTLKLGAGVAFAGLAVTALMSVAQTPGHASECENPTAPTFAMIPTEERVPEIELCKPVNQRMEKLTGKKMYSIMAAAYAPWGMGLHTKAPKINIARTTDSTASDSE